MESQEMKEIIRKSGVSQKRICNMTNISTSYLSEYLNNKRVLDNDQLFRLNNYVNKLKAIL